MTTTDVALHEATRYRYLSYAMSVITSRALPDVRDGLKPVQRRILFAMYHNLRLYPDARYRKSAAVVGEVMAKYHPHGDTSIYDSMVRMSQDFSLLHPLVDGQGNFGSMDGDGAAAMRYTESKLTPLSTELISEIRQQTVDWRPNYDGQHFEPIVLPAQLPNLLINGAEGIAVGMSTRIPPHNLRSCIDACVALIDDPTLEAKDLAKKIKAPDFPTGGMILNSPSELISFYEKGSGIVKMRGTWELEKDGRRYSAIITSVPYGTNKSTLVEKIGDLIAKKKIPQLVDIRDESTDVVRIVIELKIGAGRKPETEMENAMAYLCRYTPLQSTFPMNITCLVPTENPEVSEPLRANIHDVIRHWLDFRLQTVIRRFNYELQKLKDRLHILEAFAKCFDVLDEIIAIIRASEGRTDSREKIMAKWGFDEEQTNAILDLKLYRLAKLEIQVIEEELKEKRQAAKEIQEILDSNTNLWSVIRAELWELRKLYGKNRKTKIGGEDAELSLADESAYIIDEKGYVIVTRNGWIKRQRRFTAIDKIRIKDGDEIIAIAKASTKSTMSFYTTNGTVYVIRIRDIPSTTGYGDPLQKFFSFKDGEKLVGAVALDPLSLPIIPDTVPIEDPEHSPPYGIAVSKKGRVVRFSLQPQKEPTNKSGRRYMKLSGKDDEVIAIYPAIGNEWVSLCTKDTRALCFKVDEITLVRGPGKGVYAIKLEKDDVVTSFELTTDKNAGIVTKTSRGRDVIIAPKKYGASRASKGIKLLKRGTVSDWKSPLLRLDKMFKHTHGQDSENSTEEFSSTVEESSVVEKIKPPPKSEKNESPQKVESSEKKEQEVSVKEQKPPENKKTVSSKAPPKEEPSKKKLESSEPPSKEETHPKSQKKKAKIVFRGDGSTQLRLF